MVAERIGFAIPQHNAVRAAEQLKTPALVILAVGGY
jgi:hypothetical protein